MTSLQSISKRNFILKGIKILLLTLIACIFLILFLPVIFKKDSDKIDIFYNDDNNKELLNNNSNHSVVTKPEFFGVDNSNQKYKISASQGIQNDSNHLTLSKVNANIALKDDSIFSVLSEKADISLQDNTLKLTGNVNLSFNNEATLITDEADLNYKSKHAKSTSGVTLKSNYGNISAQNFESSDSYNHIKFDGGRVKTVLFTNSENEPELKKQSK
jgi:hypothetical protein